MSDMQNLDRLVAEKTRQQAVYDRAMARLNHQREEAEGVGLTLMFGWDAFGEAISGNSLMAKAAKASDMFLILFAFSAPCLLLIKYAL